MRSKINFLMTLAITFCVSIGFSSCGGGNTASDKALELVGYMQDSDFESYVDELYFAPDKEASDKDKKKMVEMFEKKGTEMLKETKGIDSYELISEKLAEDGKSATVKIKLVYGDGNSKEQVMKMVKNADGEWKSKMK